MAEVFGSFIVCLQIVGGDDPKRSRTNIEITRVYLRGNFQTSLNRYDKLMTFDALCDCRLEDLTQYMDRKFRTDCTFTVADDSSEPNEYIEQGELDEPTPFRATYMNVPRSIEFAASIIAVEMDYHIGPRKCLSKENFVALRHYMGSIHAQFKGSL